MSRAIFDLGIDYRSRADADIRSLSADRISVLVLPLFCLRDLSVVPLNRNRLADSLEPTDGLFGDHILFRFIWFHWSVLTTFRSILPRVRRCRSGW